MGLFSKMTGGVDKKLLQTGLPGRGIITDVKLTGTTLQTGNGLVQRTCIFTMEVSLDNKAPYTATCKQRIPEIQLPQIQVGSSTVAVRANPDDLTQVAIDFNSDPPTVTTPAGQGNTSAAEILASGQPGRAVIVEWQPLGKKNPAGVDMYAYALTVMPEGKDPYQINVGNPTPPAALPFLFAGSHVPCKIGSDPNAVVIDWDQAVADEKKSGGA
jgi:hypothetical protein